MVEPVTIIVPSMAKSAVSGRRRFVDSGSQARSGSGCWYAATAQYMLPSTSWNDGTVPGAEWNINSWSAMMKSRYSSNDEITIE